MRERIFLPLCYVGLQFFFKKNVFLCRLNPLSDYAVSSCANDVDAVRKPLKTRKQWVVLVLCVGVCPCSPHRKHFPSNPHQGRKEKPPMRPSTAISRPTCRSAGRRCFVGGHFARPSRAPGWTVKSSWSIKGAMACASRAMACFQQRSTAESFLEQKAGAFARASRAQVTSRKHHRVIS